MICEEKFVKYDPDASKWTWDNLYDKTYRKEPYWQALRKNKTANERNEYFRIIL